ncbi:MAG TPA: alpha/beta hydrolase [Chthoniobacterales bacterium]|nr:alpha/beta hydrolase [Chthoniobacterales bacterium]
MEKDFKFVPLRSGGQLAFVEYGAPHGEPVFFFHGWPSSRTMAELTDSAARELNLRIISADRPGICDSSFQPNRQLIDWPDVLQQFADHLGVEQFRLLAFSGGAPYAYVAGAKLPERVRAMAIVSGAVPFADLREHTGLLPLYRWMIWFYRNQPGLLRILFLLARPIVSWRTSLRMARKFLHMLPQPDAEALQDSAAFDICFESQRRAWRGSGVNGVMADAEIYGLPWGFRLEDVAVPVRLWHGKKDRAFSFRLAEETARRLPNCVARYIDDEGHFSLPIRHMREILEDLIAV